MRSLSFMFVAALALVSPAASAAAGDPAQRERLYSSAELQADLAELYAGIERAHFNLYENLPRAEYRRLFDQMQAAIDRPETRAAAARRYQQFVAAGRVAHARIDEAGDDYARYRNAGGLIFPLQLLFRDHRAFIVENRSAVAEIPEGAEVLTLEGRPVGEWFEIGWRHISADTPYLAATLLQYDLPQILWSELGPRPAFFLNIREPSGKLRSVSIPARSSVDIRAAQISPRLTLDTEGRHARMLADGVAYLRPGPFYNNVSGATDMYDNRAFRSFIDQAFEGFIRDRAKALIIDLRDNPGGDNSFSDRMVAWFATRPFRFASAFQIKVSPETRASNAARLRSAAVQDESPSKAMAEAFAFAADGEVIRFPLPLAPPRSGSRFRGRVYVLIDRLSFSNAVNVAALIQDYGFGTIIGEETSDLATTLGAMETFALSRTGIVVGYPKAQIIRSGGGLERRGVVPDVPIEFPIVQDSSDPVLQRALRIAAQGRTSR